MTTLADLEPLTMSELVARHNGLVDRAMSVEQLRIGAKHAGPKTFSTRAKAIARILALEAELEAVEAEQAEAVETAAVVEEPVVTEVPDPGPGPEAAASQDEPAVGPTEPRAVEQDERAATPVATTKSGRVHIIRTLSEELLLQTEPALSYEDILAEVRRFFPKGSTSIACLRWYAVQLRERGERVPSRPRAPRKLPGGEV